MNLIITTTDSIEGSKITDYIGILRSSIVIGTDIAFADIIAGANKKYRAQLNSVYDKALLDLRTKAIASNADAIVGLHTDFEEIFGKGKTKFVVSLVGTAVKLDNIPIHNNASESNAVPLNVLRKQQLVITLRKKIESESYNLNDEDWNNIMSYSLYELAPLIYHKYLVLAKETVSNTPLTEKKLLLDNFIPFMRSIDYEEAANVVYSDITTAPYCTHDVINDCNLFHPKKTISLLQPENKHFIISLLDTDKISYNINDLEDMKTIAEFLDNLPDTGRYEEGRGLLFGRSGMRLLCERGHSCAVELGGFCTETLDHGLGICNLNVKGITEAEVEKINLFKEKINILESLLTIS